MNAIDILKQEHEEIERELLELEFISESKIINYPNLTHVFNKLVKIWEAHEQKEEEIFSIMKKERIIIPVRKMVFEHGELKKHREKISEAINTTKEDKIKTALDIHGKAIIKKLREHIESEDQVLYTIALEEFTEKELQEMVNILS